MRALPVLESEVPNSSVRDTFRKQNSINLSLALIAAAFALMAGVLAAFFAIADKIPATVSGQIILASTMVAVIACALSVLFGGRGISATIKALTPGVSSLHVKYDSGNFSLQGLTGMLGLVAVVVMIGFSISVRTRQHPESDERVLSESTLARLAERLTRLEAGEGNISSDLSQIRTEVQGLSIEVYRLEGSLDEQGGRWSKKQK